jgi:hypothetical protein
MARLEMAAGMPDIAITDGHTIGIAALETISGSSVASTS